MPAKKKPPPKKRPKLKLPEDFHDTLRGLLQVRPADGNVQGSRAGPPKRKRATKPPAV